MGTGDGGASPSDTGQSGTGTGRGPSPTHEILTKLKLTTATNRIFLLIKVAAMPHVASATAGVLAGFFWRAAWLLTPLRKGLPASGPTQGASALSAPQAKLISIEWAAQAAARRVAALGRKPEPRRVCRPAAGHTTAVVGCSSSLRVSRTRRTNRWSIIMRPLRKPTESVQHVTRPN
jgi:hypothetical protein